MFFIKKYSILMLIFFWIAIIYGFSSQPVTESKKLSRTFTKEIVKVIEFINPKLKINEPNLHRRTRKAAHFFNYFVLGIIISRASKGIKRNSFIKIMVMILFCLIVSSGDEFYQSFIPGRGSREMDVFIDLSGAVTGILLAYIFMTIKELKKNQNK